MFTKFLNFVLALADDIYLIPTSILDRFCSCILSRVHHNVKCLSLDLTSMERILRVAEYPYLSQLKLFNFNQDICSSYFTGVRFGSFETRILHWNYTIFPIAEEINGFEFCISVLHFWDSKTKQFQYNQLHSIVEFPHLASLNVRRADVYYVEQFLNTEKTHLPRLTELEVDYDNLVTVTDNFTRDATRGNCAKVKWLIFEITIEYSRAVHAYFPSL
ncbi:unnamed protein product [Rotaria socialis]|uniref:Uncharacterized protein n=1 Tax=Rotaria socialis TaxID=392032 RepID=A0A817LNB3_9BILA|nr:unnamed protein product [Rotaria socialis]